MPRNVIFILLGSTLLSLALIGPVFTQYPELSEGHWKTYVLARWLWVFSLTSLALWLITCDFLKSKISRAKWGTIFVLLGCLASAYPCALLLITGPKEIHGTIANIDFSKKSPTYGLKKYGAHNPRPLKVDSLIFIAADNKKTKVRLIRKDTSLALKVIASQPNKTQTFRCRYLPFIGRLLVFEPSE